MRVWYKHIIDDREGDKPLTVHPVGFQECPLESKEEFFDRHGFSDARGRFHLYNAFLSKHVNPGDEGLSVGSGDCVNEIYLNEQGRRVVCSDINDFRTASNKALFPDTTFVLYDPTDSPFDRRFNYIISLSVFFQFGTPVLAQVLQNLYKSLNPGGQLFFDPGGAKDGLLTRLIDNGLCPWETRAKSFLNKQVFIRKIHHGYRYPDKELVGMACKEGFKLIDVYYADYETELVGRSAIFRRLPAFLINRIGRSSPYIRLFHFKKD